MVPMLTRILTIEYLTDVPSTNDSNMIFRFTAAQSSPPTIYWFGNWAYSCDFNNNDLTNAQIPGQYCSNLCAQTPHCTHYIWNQTNGGTCWMKYGFVLKSDAFPTDNPTMVCGVLPNQLPSAFIYWTGDWAYSCDFNNSDLTNAQIPGQYCSNLCAQTPHCTHYIWNQTNGGTCWMKYGSVSKSDAFPTNDSTMVCGVLPNQLPSASIYWTGDWAYSCDFNNSDLTNVQIPGQYCSNQCAKTSGCTHYTWNQFNNGTCWMKYGLVSKSDAFPTDNPTMVCGVLPNQLPSASIHWTGDWAYSCDFNNSDLTNVQIPGQYCSNQCAKTSGCTHYTWNQFNNGTCWMKYGLVSKSDAFSTDNPTMVCGVLPNQLPSASIYWTGDWAYSCDFNNSDLTNVQIPGADCSNQCARTSGCTHYTWNQFNNGTCWMKYGSVSKNDAFPTDDPTMVCGILSEKSLLQASGTTTQYWDCCKPSCAWPNRVSNSNTYVQSCSRDGSSVLADPDATSGCDNDGVAFTCSDLQPWPINNQLAYGFAAANIPEKNAQDLCCVCYQLDFTSDPVQGKSIIVQVINTRSDVDKVQFDLYIPGRGVGLSNGCTSQWNASSGEWSQQYGGVSSSQDCYQLPAQLQNGCLFTFDWLGGTNNPTIIYSQVTCPSDLVAKSGCSR